METPSGSKICLFLTAALGYEKYGGKGEKKILRGWRSSLEKTVAKYPGLAAPNLATGASNSATGRLFSGQRVRTFDPSLLMFDDSSAAPGAPSTSTVFDGGPSCERWCVVTTIFEPSVALTSTAKLPGWCTVIVGDHKTPPNYLARAGLQDMPSVVFLSAERQQREANERDDRHQMLSRESLGPMHDLLAPTLRAMG